MCNNSISGTAIPLVFIENKKTRVTEWRFKKRGDNTGWHRHDYDYVVVPLFNGVLEIETKEGPRIRNEMKMGVPYFRKAGTEHDVINPNDIECAFIEIEFLS